MRPEPIRGGVGVMATILIAGGAGEQTAERRQSPAAGDARAFHVKPSNLASAGRRRLCPVAAALCYDSNSGAQLVPRLWRR